MKGRSVSYDTLEQHFATAQVRRHLDASGYIQFRYWRLYGAEGLAGKNADVLLYHNTLTVAYEDESLTQYQIHYAEDATTIDQVRLTHEFPARFPSVQMHLWELSRFEWRKTMRQQRRRSRPHSSATVEQLMLFPQQDEKRRRRGRHG